MAARDGPRSRHRWRRVVVGRARRGLLIFLAMLIVEYLVVPELVGASRNLDLLSRLNVGWLVAGIGFEAGALVCYALLVGTLLLNVRPPIFTLVRIIMATTATAHVVPGGAAGGAGLGYQLLTSAGVDGADAGFGLGSAAIGSAIVLNAMLWVALLVSIPLAGLHTIYVVIALVGLLALLAASALVYLLTRGEEHAVSFVRAVGRRIPRVGADRLERVVRQVGASVVELGRDRVLLRRAFVWSGLNWLLDAASLWAFVAAFGHAANPVELFTAYGIANVLAVIPVTPGGLGVIEATAAALLVSFGIPHAVATLGVLGWRLVNFWLPIPLGVVAYLSLVLPRGSGIRAGRRALSHLAADVRNPTDEHSAGDENGVGTARDPDV